VCVCVRTDCSVSIYDG